MDNVPGVYEIINTAISTFHYIHMHIIKGKMISLIVMPVFR